MMAFFAMVLLSSDPANAPATAPEKPKLVCREGEQQTGTHRRTGRLCKTAEEWREEEARLTNVPPSLRVTNGQEDGHAVQRPQ
jgi:hypothetical protein